MNLLGFIGQIFLPGSRSVPASPSPRPLLSLLFRPCVCFVFESRLLSLVLRLGTHCACFHGHWEALSAMCFKGEPFPSQRLLLPAPGGHTMSGSSEPGL